MKRLHVLHVLNELKPSGAEVMLLAALPAFRQQGIEFSILSTGQKKGIFAERFEALGCEIINIPFSRSPVYFLKAWKVFRSKRFDVIHLHSDLANFYFGIAALATRKAVLRTVHNAFEHQGSLRLRRMLQRRMLRRMGVCHVAISPSVANNELKRFGLKTELVDNWFDHLRFRLPSVEERAAARRSYNLAEDSFALISVGNCNDVKNHGSILRAMARLPDTERLVYLHAGLEDKQQSERKLADELGLQLGQKVRFLGPVGDVVTLLRAADAFVMPSHYEGFGVAAMEALGSGVPSILSDSPGLRDFSSIFPEIVYCGTDEESVASSIEKVMKLTESEKRGIGASQADRARQRFGIDQGVDGYVRLYRQLT